MRRLKIRQISRCSTIAQKSLNDRRPTRTVTIKHHFLTQSSTIQSLVTKIHYFLPSISYSLIFSVTVQYNRLWSYDIRRVRNVCIIIIAIIINIKLISQHKISMLLLSIWTFKLYRTERTCTCICTLHSRVKDLGLLDIETLTLLTITPTLTLACHRNRLSF